MTSASYSFVKDRFVESSAATIHISERGFRFGDGVFETIPFYNQVFYQWEFHLRRLEQGLAAMRIAYDATPLETLAKELIERNPLQNGFIRIYISRGQGSRGYLPTDDCKSLLVMELLPPTAEQPTSATLLLSSYQRIMPAQLPTRAKLAQGVQSTLARLEAQDESCFEALLCDMGGNLAECSSSNIFWLKNNSLFTPSLDTGALAGSMRHVVMRVSPYPVIEVRHPLESLHHAEAVVITNSNWRVLPVSSLAPQNWEWDSRRTAHLLNTAIEEDIRSHCSIK